jgi:uncharacterized protein YbaR (Trm112 family)
MTIDHRLLEMLVCPVCKSALRLKRDPAGLPDELICVADRLAYPIRDGIPVMLDHEARALPPEEEVA